MTDYNDCNELVNLLKNDLVSIDKRIQEAVDIFIQTRNIMKYSDDLENSSKIRNIQLLTTNNLFMIHELLINIILKNYISSFSLIRVLIENIYTIIFLKNSSEDINEVYYDYSNLCMIGVWDEEKIVRYELKYSVKINKNKDKQWIDQIKGNSRFNGFSYIKDKVHMLGKTHYYDWYKTHSSFIHSSLSATRLNISLFLDDDKFIQFRYDFLFFIVNDLLEVFKNNEDYLKCDIEQKNVLIKKILKFFESY